EFLCRSAFQFCECREMCREKICCLFSYVRYRKPDQQTSERDRARRLNAFEKLRRFRIFETWQLEQLVLSEFKNVIIIGDEVVLHEELNCLLAHAVHVERVLAREVDQFARLLLERT